MFSVNDRDLSFDHEYVSTFPSRKWSLLYYLLIFSSIDCTSVFLGVNANNECHGCYQITVLVLLLNKHVVLSRFFRISLTCSSFYCFLAQKCFSAIVWP